MGSNPALEGSSQLWRCALQYRLSAVIQVAHHVMSYLEWFGRRVTVQKWALEVQNYDQELACKIIQWGHFKLCKIMGVRKLYELGWYYLKFKFMNAFIDCWFITSKFEAKSGSSELFSGRHSRHHYMVYGILIFLSLGHRYLHKTVN